MFVARLVSWCLLRALQTVLLPLEMCVIKRPTDKKRNKFPRRIYCASITNLLFDINAAAGVVNNVCNLTVFQAGLPLPKKKRLV